MRLRKQQGERRQSGTWKKAWGEETGHDPNHRCNSVKDSICSARNPRAVPQVYGHAAERCGLRTEEVRSGFAEPQMSGVESSHSEVCCFNPPSSISASNTGLLSGQLLHSRGLSLFSIPLPSKLWCSLLSKNTSFWDVDGQNPLYSPRLHSG